MTPQAVDAKQALTAEAIAEKTRELESGIAACDRVIDEQRTKKTELRAELVGWKRVSEALAQLNGEARNPRTRKGVADRIREALADGLPHKVGDIAERAGIAPANVTSHMTSLVGQGHAVRVGTGTYQKPHQQAASAQPVQPAHAAPLEPIRGSAPQSKCPVCTPTRWVTAIGMRDGRYVFKCVQCRQSWTGARGDSR